MADSVTATDIPPGVYDLVGGYVDGAYAWTDADWLFHHTSRLVRIAVDWRNQEADVLDVEQGDATPGEAVAWTQTRRANGQGATLYFSSGLYSQVAAAFAAVGAPVPYVWVAQWDGVYSGWYGAVAKQYANPTLSGGHYDLSWVADYWPGIDTGPAPGPIPIPSPPPPTPAPVPPIDGARAAYGDLAGFLTAELPAGVANLNLLAGLFRQGA